MVHLWNNKSLSSLFKGYQVDRHALHHLWWDTTATASITFSLVGLRCRSAVLLFSLFSWLLLCHRGSLLLYILLLLLHIISLRYNAAYGRKPENPTMWKLSTKKRIGVIKMWKIGPFVQKSDFLDKYQTKFDHISAKSLIIRPKSDKSDQLGSTGIHINQWEYECFM